MVRPHGVGGDGLRFLRSWMTEPATTGAVSPSGRALSRAMARAAGPDRGLPVLELGPGTGPVTRALIARGFAPESIVTVETNHEFASLLVDRFRGLNVVEGDAYQLATTLPPGLTGPYGAVVSSLPLLNRPYGERVGLVEQALGLVADGGPLVQFSYGVHPPVAAEAGRFGVARKAIVLFNLPPAQVWTYRRT